MTVRWDTAIGRRAGLAALVALAVALSGCGGVSEADTCRNKGLAEGSPAFADCVAGEQATSARYRNQLIRHGGAGR